MKRLLLLYLLLPCAALARPPPQPPSSPSVSVLTFATGEIYWQRFGHNALLVRDAGGERVYNYGIFDFRQENFLLNFARGVMRYRVEVEPLWQTLSQYQRERRWVREQRLDLTPAQAQALAGFLAWNARPENKEYRYDYFLSNCSTRVRDAVDQALGGALRAQFEAQATGSTYRSEATRLMSPDFWWFVGMDVVVAAQGDLPINEWQKAFSPFALMQALRHVRVNERPLVLDERLLVDVVSAEPPAQAPSLLAPAAVLGLLLGLALALLSRSRRAAARYGFAFTAFSFNLLAGIGGLILLAIWTLTEHWSWHANHNLLLLNPLCLLLLPACAQSACKLANVGRASAQLAWVITLGALVIAILPGQDQAAWVALLLPVHGAIAYGIFRITRLRPV